MNNLTKMKITKPANDVFEAFVDPAKIRYFWFSSSSGRWEQGKTVALKYDEYNAQMDIAVIEVIENKKNIFQSRLRCFNGQVRCNLANFHRRTAIMYVNGSVGTKLTEPILNG